MDERRLIQFQCHREGTLFYYQASMIDARQIVNRCPVCGSKRVAPTGRNYRAVDELKTIAKRRVRPL